MSTSDNIAYVILFINFKCMQCNNLQQKKGNLTCYGYNVNSHFVMAYGKK